MEGGGLPRPSPTPTLFPSILVTSLLLQNEEKGGYQNFISFRVTCFGYNRVLPTIYACLHFLIAKPNLGMQRHS